jgi:PIN domain nuclease of toxin-antitoxin system
MGAAPLILLDTHVLIWMLSDSKRLSIAAEKAIHQTRASQDGLAISSLSLFEIAHLSSRGRLGITGPLDILLRDIEEKFIVKNITSRVAYLAFSFPASFPNDPMDRMIAATALAEDIPLVTADERIRKSKAVQVIW